jgi:crotonobetainyl-CoA:carnitine CoA-transferase CaiB-like acyl-CoA transferase
MFAPLDGVKVIDLTQILAGPYCTELLALLGAEVIKVEPPGVGDPTRAAGAIPELNQAGLGLAFCAQNADKASIAIDLKRPEGVEIVKRLTAQADVFVENYRPGVAARLGLGVDDLTAVNPNLVYVSLSAYGQDGPIGHRPAYDHVVQAMSGIMETTGTAATGPIKVGAPFVDYGAGLKGAFATVAAIMEQRRTGEPQRVDSAMLDASLLLTAGTLTATATTGRRPPKLGNRAASGSPSSGCFETADGLLAVAANNERQFADLCRAIDRPDLIDDARFASPQARQQHGDAFGQLLAAELRTRDANHWESTMDRYAVPASRVRAMDETLQDGQPEARSLLADLDVNDHNVRLPTAGFKANGETPKPRRPPPALGVDTEAVLSGVGYRPDQIASLVQSGVVEGPSGAMGEGLEN